MRSCALVFVSMLMVALGGLAQSQTVTGSWDLEMRWPDVTSSGSCTFQQDGETLTGSCGSGTDRFPVTGTVKGSRLSWEFYVRQDGAEGRMEFDGELDASGAAITGTCAVVDGPSGIFGMKRRTP